MIVSYVRLLLHEGMIVEIEELLAEARANFGARQIRMEGFGTIRSRHFPCISRKIAPMPCLILSQKLRD